MSRATAIALGLLGVLAVGAITFGSSSSGEESRPPGSSAEDGGAEGLSAWRELLESRGRAVEVIDEPPSDSDLDRAATVVLLDPGALADSEREALAGHVSAGGRLLTGGDTDARTLAALAGPGLTRRPGGAAIVAPLVPAPELAGVTQVESAGEASFEVDGASLPLLGGGSETLAVRAAGERGGAVVLADSSPLRNAYIDRLDNAQLALALTEERPVIFVDRVETVEASGIGALPASWLWTGIGLLAAALALVAARARRLGPPDPPGRELPPPRREYVDALAAWIARSGAPAAAAEPVRSAARAELARKTARGEPSRAELERVGGALGLSEAELAAILDPDREAAVIDAGRALAKLHGAGTRATEVNG